MSYIDLHIHTTASDGTDSPRAAVEKAAALGLAAVSITDHDSVSGVPEAMRAGAELGVEVVSEADLGVKIEVEETGETFAENSLLKAKAVMEATKLPAIADDSGLCVDALDGEPGIYSARYASADGENASDAANVEKLLEKLKGIPSGERTARFVCAIALVLPDGSEKTVTGEKVLCAIGRRAYWDGVFAEGMNPETRGKSLKVDENFQTSIPGVYAIGDASSVVQLAHVAAAQGTACVERMYGVADHVDLNVIPSCIYSAPEIAVVGLTEAEARERGIPAVSGKCTLFSNARTIIEDPGRCFMKLVARTDTHELIGAQLMCQHASDMISQISATMVNHQTAEELRRVMRPHPSFEEAMTEALERLAEKL